MHNKSSVSQCPVHLISHIWSVQTAPNCSAFFQSGCWWGLASPTGIIPLNSIRHPDKVLCCSLARMLLTSTCSKCGWEKKLWWNLSMTASRDERVSSSRLSSWSISRSEGSLLLLSGKYVYFLHVSDFVGYAARHLWNHPWSAQLIPYPPHTIFWIWVHFISMNIIVSGNHSPSK